MPIKIKRLLGVLLAVMVLTGCSRPDVDGTPENTGQVSDLPSLIDTAPEETDHVFEVEVDISDIP